MVGCYGKEEPHACAAHRCASPWTHTTCTPLGAILARVMPSPHGCYCGCCSTRCCAAHLRPMRPSQAPGVAPQVKDRSSREDQGRRRQLLASASTPRMSHPISAPLHGAFSHTATPLPHTLTPPSLPAVPLFNPTVWLTLLLCLLTFLLRRASHTGKPNASSSMGLSITGVGHRHWLMIWGWGARGGAGVFGGGERVETGVGG